MQAQGDRGSYLSSRGSRINGFKKRSHALGFAMYLRDSFNKNNNPQGILDFGTSENKLCFDIIEERLTRPGMNYLEPHLLQYSDMQGIKCFREELASFLTEYTRAPKPLNPEHIFIMNGCCSVLAALTTVLCDPGDGCLLPTPVYSGAYPNMWKYGELRPVHVPLSSEIRDGETHPFQLTIEKLEASMQRAKEQGIQVRAFILVNPNNPLGNIYSAQLLKECLDFAYRYKLHVIIDEIYMLSVYDETTFTSVLSLDDLPDPERTHFMWGFSKDFAVGGLRVGVLHTRSKEVREAVSQLTAFHGCPVLVQHVLSQLLSDREWVNNTFLPGSRGRLKEAHHLLVDGLTTLGIPVLKSSAGLYVWADFRKFLRSQTFEAEEALWWKLIEEKLFICPGKAYDCYEPGWFRLVFSESRDSIILAIQRLQKALHMYSSELGLVPACALRQTAASETGSALSGLENESSDDGVKTLENTAETLPDLETLAVY